MTTSERFTWFTFYLFNEEVTKAINLAAYRKMSTSVGMTIILLKNYVFNYSCYNVFN